MTNQTTFTQEESKMFFDCPYNEVYLVVVDAAKDARRFDTSKEEDIEKCKWIAAMVDVLFDVPMHKACEVLHLNNVKFNYKEFIAENHAVAKPRIYKKRTLADYHRFYDSVLDVAFDADTFNATENTSDELIEKCMWIMAMCDVFSETYLDVITPSFNKIGFHFDWEEFAKEHNL